MQQGPNSNAGVSQGDAVDVSEVLRGVARRWPMILVFTLLALAGAIAFVTVAKDKYTGTAKVIIEDLTTPYTQVQTADRSQSGLQDRDVMAQVEIITSRNLAAKVIDRGVSDRTRAILSRKSKSKLPDIFGMVGLGSKSRTLSERERALANLDKNLVVYRIERSSVIVIEFTAGDAAMAAEVANAVAEAYVDSTRDAQTKPINVARDWLSEQIEDLREKVVKSEVAVEEYRARAGLVLGQSVKLSNQALSELNSQIIVAAAARSEAEARANSIRQMLRRTGTVDGASDVLNSAFIQRLREQQVGLRRRIAELSSTYLDNHPRIVGAKRELDDLNKQVRGEVLKIVNGLEQQAKIAAAREASLRENLQGLKTKASASSVDEVKLRALEREATANRTLLETFLNRFNDASTRERSISQPGLARVISSAGVPVTPSFPKRGPIVLLSALAGMVVGAGLAFLIEVMAAASRVHRAASVPVRPQEPAAIPVQPAFTWPDNAPASVAAPPVQNHRPFAPGTAPPQPATPPRVTPQVSTPAQAVTPALCAIPSSAGFDLAARNALSILSEPSSDYAAGVRTVASWAMSVCQSLSAKRIAFASLPGLEVDAATAAVATARQLAANNLRVVIVDGDMARGLVTSIVQSQPRAGLAELIAGTATFSDVIVCDYTSAAHIIQAGQNTQQARQMLDAERMAMVLEALEHAYDIVLVNAGKADFPAEQTQFALTASNAAVVLTQTQFAGPATALCGSMVQGGMKAAQYVTVRDAEDLSTASRIAAAVNS